MALAGSRMFLGIIKWYSLLIVSGMIIAYFLSKSEEKRIGLPKDTVLDFILFAIPLGIIGARLYYVIFSIDYFLENPTEIIKINNGGLAILGGIIAGLLVLIVFCSKRKIDKKLLLDAVAPGIVLAQGIGRWGNYFNREAYGREITSDIFKFFPIAVIIPQNGQMIWHMATFFYESIWDILCFMLLWNFRKKVKYSGDVFLGYLLIYSCGRAVIEGMRTDSLYLGDFRISQLLSIVACLTICILTLSRCIKINGSKQSLFALPILVIITIEAIFYKNDLNVIVVQVLFITSLLFLYMGTKNIKFVLILLLINSVSSFLKTIFMNAGNDIIFTEIALFLNMISFIFINIEFYMRISFSNKEKIV